MGITFFAHNVAVVRYSDSPDEKPCVDSAFACDLKKLFRITTTRTATIDLYRVNFKPGF